MLQLKTSLSPTESELLLKCLSDMETDLKNRRSASRQNIQTQTALASARHKIQSQVYDCFYRDEITNMVFALDSLTRKCRAQLENIPADRAADIGSELRTAAITISKLKRAAAGK